LTNKTKISVAGKTTYADSRSTAQVILALGHTRDRRSIPLLCDILLSGTASPSARWQAAKVLGVLGAPELSMVPSTFVPQAKVTPGYVLSEKDRAQIRDALIKAINDTEMSVRSEAMKGLEMIGQIGESAGVTH
jgi:hypothetical protein